MTRNSHFLTLLAGLALLLPVPTALADLTLNGRSGLIAMNMPNIGQETLYLRKHQLRRDFTSRGRTYTFLYDLKRREIAMLDHFQRQAAIHALAAPAGKATDKAAEQDFKLELTPSGQKQRLQHWDCELHTLEASLPAELGPEKVTLLLGGRIWLARKAAEKKQLAPFIRSIEAEDFFMGAPGQSGNPQARGVNEVIRRILPKGMICAGEINIQYLGDGPLANLGRRLATRMNIAWETISDAPIDEGIFAIPEGYQQIRN